MIALWLLDHALGYGAAVVIVALWLPRLPPLPWRLAVEAAVVVAFAIASAAGSASSSIAIALAIAFSLFWIPSATGAGRSPSPPW